MSVTDSAETAAAPGQDTALPVLGAGDEQLLRELTDRARAGGSRQTITTITDRVMDGMAEWQSRPLDQVYAVFSSGQIRACAA